MFGQKPGRWTPSRGIPQMRKMSGCPALARFQGCLLGGLVGDCLSFPFRKSHRDSPFKCYKIQSYFEDLLYTKNVDFKMYSDDTSMTKSVVKHILEAAEMSMTTKTTMADTRSNLDPGSLAERFHETYYTERTDRKYGDRIGYVLALLNDLKFANNEVFHPAEQQFNGGSFGSGAALRVAPLALLYSARKLKNSDSRDLEPERLVRSCIDSARITHAHPLAIVGSVFQALGVRTAFQFGQDVEVDKISAFRPNNNHNCAHYKTKVEPSKNVFDQDQKTADALAVDLLNEFEEDFRAATALNHNSAFKEYVDECMSRKQELELHRSIYKYSKKISLIRQFLDTPQTYPTNVDKVFKVLRGSYGCGKEAINTVPVALFSFLAAFQPVTFFQDQNQFQRTIQLSICLGGHSTASMAGSMAGAFLGVDSVDSRLSRHCEDASEILNLAQLLYLKTHGGKAGDHDHA